MEVQISTASYSDKAWCLVAVLLSIGRPASPKELAEKCSLFCASPEFVEFLCSIPNSPIFLCENGVVLLSSVAFSVIGGFFASSVVSEGQIDVFGSVRSFFSRFRSGIGPFERDRVITRLIEANERVKEPESFGCCGTSVLPLNAPALDRPIVVALAHFSDKALTPSMTISNTGLLEYQSKKDEDDNEGSESKLNAAQVDELDNYVALDRDEDEYLNIYKTILDMPETPREGCGAILFKSLEQIAAFLGVDEPYPVDPTSTMEIDASPCRNVDEHDRITSVKAVVDVHRQKDFIEMEIPETRIQEMVEKPVTDEHDRSTSVKAVVDVHPQKDFIEMQISETMTEEMVEKPFINVHDTNASVKAVFDVYHDIDMQIPETRIEEMVEKALINEHDKNASMKAVIDVNPQDFIEREIRETRMEEMVEKPLIDEQGRNTSVKAVVDVHPQKDSIEMQIPETRTEKMVEKPLTNEDDRNASVKVVGIHPQKDSKEMQIPETRIEEMVEKPLTDEHYGNTSVKAVSEVHPQQDFVEREIPEISIEEMVEKPLADYSFHEERAEKEKLPVKVFGGILCHKTIETPAGKHQNLHEETPNDKASNQDLVPAKTESCQKTLSNDSNPSAVPQNGPQIDPALKQKALPNLQHNCEVKILRKDGRELKDQTTIVLTDNRKQIVKDSTAVHEKCENKSVKEQDKSKYPKFESYVVEEEEGSGGYGTVYRARRKTDGVTFAIKCPHENAHIQHMKNELKMLQRFGGKNFIIKFEGSAKSGKADCFVLEHVEHDRAEALKREIDIYQLQWYGFCLFKALSSLHKQGVFHRDVKPGNFLFSCKTSKGYLIDFNLAKDLQKMPGSFDQLQSSYTSAAEHIPTPQHKFESPNKRRKILRGKPSEAFKAGITSGSNNTLEGKQLKRKPVEKLKAYEDLGRRNSRNSQGADASGLTSKDITSTRTSREKLREPVPCHGRKELITLAQEAMLSPNLGLGSAPLSKRKRVTASPVLMDSKKFLYLTPTPLHSSGNCIPDTGSWKNKGVKPIKEGPCVGTKGFRAPEVLLRSSYQGPKIDVWSAGVTLLYLITGKMPFAGDPEQNLKDIVKMKGNEEVWEVAKLHNRESSLPQELLDVKYLPSTTVKEWCIANTKRNKFMHTIPCSLYDLIEKCLTVNPRLRITAEEALRHDFFTPCHESLQTVKLHRLSQNQRSRLNSLPLLNKPILDR